MSVTFTFAQLVDDPHFGTVMMHGIDCHHECTETPVPCADAFEWGLTHCEHAEAAEIACGCTKFDVNLSQDNAGLILARLGIPFHDEHGDECMCGNTDPDDILGRAMLGDVDCDDSGIPWHEEKGARGATAIDCGLRPGFFAETLAAIAGLATEAKARGVRVGWA